MVDAQSSLGDEANIMDVLAVLAESWWILIGLPVIGAAAAFVFIAASPTQFQATARVALITNGPTLARSANFDEALAAHIPNFGESVHAVVVDNDGTTNTTRAVVVLPNAARAKQLAVGTLETLRKLEPVDSSELDRELEVRNQEIERLKRAIDLLQQSLQLWVAKSGAGDGVSRIDATAADALVVLSGTLAEKQVDLIKLQDEIVKVQSLATTPPMVDVVQIARDRRPVIAMFLVGGVLAVVIVYLRYVISLARLSPGYNEKSARIWNALSFLHARGGKVAS